MIRVTYLLSGILLSSLLGCAVVTKEPPHFTPVSGFNLERYLGTWYEIARMPSWFEKDLVRVTATYSLRPDGKVDVLNAGYKPGIEGKKKSAHGKAKFAGDTFAGHLRVSFFGPFYADYIIVELDSSYRYALVTGDSYKYLWILSRTPQLDSASVNHLLEKAKTLGFDLSKLYMVPQEESAAVKPLAD